MRCGKDLTSVLSFVALLVQASVVARQRSTQKTRAEVDLHVLTRSDPAADEDAMRCDAIDGKIQNSKTPPFGYMV